MFLSHVKKNPILVIADKFWLLHRNFRLAYLRLPAVESIMKKGERQYNLHDAALSSTGWDLCFNMDKYLNSIQFLSRFFLHSEGLLLIVRAYIYKIVTVGPKL